MIFRVIKKMMTSSINTPCKGYQCNHPLDPAEYDCEYEKAGDILCDDCVCNFGEYNPRTGKRMNWILRQIQKRRAYQANIRRTIYERVEK